MLKLSSIRADLDRERQGDWIDSRQWPGVRFCVRALTAPAYQIRRDALVQRLTRQRKGKPIPTDELTPHLGKLYAEEILLNWDGIDVPYSHEKAVELLTDPAWRELVNEIEYCAGTLASVDADFVGEELGKSEKPSAPSSKSATKSPTASET